MGVGVVLKTVLGIPQRSVPALPGSFLVIYVLSRSCRAGLSGAFQKGFEHGMRVGRRRPLGRWGLVQVSSGVDTAEIKRAYPSP